jgi:hypothetical protein
MLTELQPNTLQRFQFMVASVNVVENRPGAEVAIDQAARGGSLRVSTSGSGASSSAIASTCM